MTPRPVLERFSVVDADDLDEFRASVSRALTPHRLVPLDHAGRVEHASVAVAPLGSLSLVYGEHRGTELGATLTEQVDYYDVNLSWGGRNLISCGDDEVVVDPHTAGIISPRMQARMRLSSDYRQLHVRFERYALERHLEQMLGRTVVAPIRFRMGMDLRGPAAASWARAVRLLVDDLDEPLGLAGAVDETNPFAGFLMTGLLLAQPHNYSDQLAERRHGAHRPTPVKRVVDLIEAHPEEDLSVERLTAAVPPAGAPRPGPCRPARGRARQRADGRRRRAALGLHARPAVRGRLPRALRRVALDDLARPARVTVGTLVSLTGSP